MPRYIPTDKEQNNLFIPLKLSDKIVEGTLASTIKQVVRPMKSGAVENTALLVPQDSQYSEQASGLCADESNTDDTNHVDGTQKGGCV
jgi:hypothetical protein